MELLSGGGTGVQDRARVTRRSLLEAAAHLFAEQGYAGTSINDISALSGRTSGAIYFHYSSKEKLALAVVREQFAAWPQLAARYRAADVPPLERLVALSFEIARALREEPIARAGARLWTERRTIDAVVPAPFAVWTGAATRLLAQARTEGELAAGVEPSATAGTLVCAFFGLYTLTEELVGQQGLLDRLHEWWLLVLNALQARPDAAALLARARKHECEPVGALP
ncbi:ScbR family autoregulator-binding transcription factor [Streptomyces sp. DT24]|uniref:ScbR family autoregulator-binding transcription factor n=1 Tax=unclassified Streptomyces TaxID=2593676 RepID=UPI0023B98621|nr:ScbR family autoregulator-binding transcription factor [Streptomyces sp. AM 4-1-1]WEH36361.1 ScbR family autoregulator-binding transcription factor [Streptomyces sp. AM 4-1-1]